jgi:plasmid maintenance system antidote protein VapI
LGDYTSAALPRLWTVIRKRRLSASALARELGINNAMMAKLLYGDRRAGRDLALRCEQKLGIPISLWSAPLPSAWALPKLENE